MNARERFLATLRDGRLGCAPHFERGVREEVLAHWREQGVSAARAEAVLDWDRWQIGGLHENAPAIDLMPRPALEAPITSPSQVADWQCRFADEDRYPADWDQHVAELDGRDWPFGLNVFRGLLLTLGVSNAASLTDVVYFMMDHGEVVEDMLAFLADWQTRVLERAFVETKPDFIICREPIAGNYGPVLGPNLVRRFLVPIYRRMVEFSRGHGVQVFIWETYGQAEPLLPAILEAGFNALCLGHAGIAGTDYRRLRERLGPAVGLIGGIDSRLLDARPEVIREQVTATVAPLLRTGRYVPMLDDRLRANADFAGLSSYRRALDEALAQGAAR